jgi:hypothetical protein
MLQSSKLTKDLSSKSSKKKINKPLNFPTRPSKYVLLLES